MEELSFTLHYSKIVINLFAINRIKPIDIKNAINNLLRESNLKESVKEKLIKNKDDSGLPIFHYIQTTFSNISDT